MAPSSATPSSSPSSLLDIQKGFDDIFKHNNGVRPRELEGDRGLEFVGKSTQNYFSSHNIFYSQLTLSASHGFMIESSIKLVKRRTFLLLSLKLSNDGVRALKEAISQLNNRVSESLANLSPARIQFSSILQSAQIRQILNRVRGRKQCKPSVEEALAAQQRYEASPDAFRPGDVVLVPHARAALQKSSLPTVRGC